MARKMVQLAPDTPRNAKDLDKIDRRILDELQTSGRMPVMELARRVNLSKTPCIRRIERLEREGFIKDYVARLDAERMGFEFLAFVEVSLERNNSEVLKRFSQAVQDFEEIIDCQMVLGDFDYVLRVNVASKREFRRFMLDKLNSIQGLVKTRTVVSLGEVKSTTKLPTLPSISRRRLRRRKP